MLVTLGGNTADAADEAPYGLVESATAAVEFEAFIGPDLNEVEELANLRQARVGAASRSYVREDGALRVEISADLPETFALELEGELQPVAVTPAPAFCSFTGLTHLPETHELCTHPSNNTPDQNRVLGQYLAAQRGWTGNQWQCLDNLMTRESRWRHTAANPVSTARGIPQKMMSIHYGANWRTSATAAAWLNDPEAQIEWGLNYISRRYSTPCGAWNFFQRNGWY